LLIEERLVISKKCVQARNEEWNNSELLKIAWVDLMISYPAENFVADVVDLKCLTPLEARIFEDSEEAGPPGNQQWGLDTSQHHRRWSVHLNIPNECVIGRDYSESQLEEKYYLL
jgi:hypothetical protein